jgi:hypothetical protein
MMSDVSSTTPNPTRPPRKPKQSAIIKLTDQERMLVALYRTVPESTRAVVGNLLVHTWQHPITAEEKQEQNSRFTAELHSTGLLRGVRCSAFDAVKSGAR